MDRKMENYGIEGLSQKVQEHERMFARVLETMQKQSEILDKEIELIRKEFKISLFIKNEVDGDLGDSNG